MGQDYLNGCRLGGEIYGIPILCGFAYSSGLSYSCLLYTSDILQKLLHKERCSSEGHVGIWNVQQRLSIIYGDAASISFKNAPSGGGIVTISLPLQITPENSIF